MHAELEMATRSSCSPIRSRRQHEGSEGLGGTSVNIMTYVEDTDAAYKRAIDTGATR